MAKTWRNDPRDDDVTATPAATASVSGTVRARKRVPVARIVRWSAGALAAILFCIAVYAQTVALDNDEKPPGQEVPAVIYVLLLIVLFSAVGPLMMEFKTTGQRVARVIIAVLICGIISPVIVAGIVGLEGLVVSFLP